MRNISVTICAMVIGLCLINSSVVLAECPSMDVTGDCKVDFEDFAVFADEWLSEGVMPYSNLTRSDIASMEADMSTASIDASDDNEFMPGTYFIYKTDEGRFGKFMVESYEPAENHRLTIRWVTYNANGTVYSHGTGLVIRGTYSCDLDEGQETSTGRDWQWNMLTSTTRRLDPKNGAEFKLMYRAKSPDDMVWVYIDDTATGTLGYKGYMSKYETTNAQYCQYLNAALADGLITVYNDVVYAVSDTEYSEPYFDTYAEDTDSQITYSGGTFSVRTRDGYDMSDHPVIMVSWYGATTFADYYGFRLPTEWEWQAVADYDGTYTYGCGTIIDYTRANFDEANPLGLSFNSPYTSPVGYYPTYGYGMCDMAGNVWEWTSSCYYSDCDPDYRVIRGGDWFNKGSYCGVSERYNFTPNTSNSFFGFRVCR